MPDPLAVAEPVAPRPAAAPIATLVGNLAPAFDLPCTRFPDPTRSRVSLADYHGRWLTLIFYPRDFSLVCPTELIGLSQRFDEFAAMNCELLGVSCDSVESHGAGSPRRGLAAGWAVWPFRWRATSTERPRGLMEFIRRRAPGRARAIHYRSGRIGAIPGRPQSERGPAEPGSPACWRCCSRAGCAAKIGCLTARPSIPFRSSGRAAIFRITRLKPRPGRGPSQKSIAPETFSSIARWRSRSSSLIAR